MSSKLKKYLRLIAIAAVMALVVAACGEAGNGTTTTSTDGGSGGEDALGTVVIPAGESIQIRAHQVQSGPNTALGVDQIRGVELAVADYGDIHGFSVDLGTAEDDLCAAEGGQSGANSIIAQDGVLAVIGTTCSGAAHAALPIYSNAGLVMVSGSNTGPELTSDMQGNPGEQYLPGYFRTAHNDLFQGAAVAKFVYEELGFTTAAAIHDGDPYTEGLGASFRTAFEALGGEVRLFTATTGAAGVDQTALLTSVAAADVEVVFFPIFPATGGPEIIQQKDDIAGLEDVVWFSADGLFNGEFLGITETEGMYFSGPDLDFGANQSVTGTNYQQLVANYQAEYGEAPPAPFHAHTYDATVLVLSAIEAVGVVGDDGSLSVGRQALRDWLSDVSNFAGVIGSLTCDEFGDCGSQRIQVAHHQSTSVTDISETPVVASYTRDDLIGLITGE